MRAKPSRKCTHAQRSLRHDVVVPDASVDMRATRCGEMFSVCNLVCDVEGKKLENKCGVVFNFIPIRSLIPDRTRGGSYRKLKHDQLIASVLVYFLLRTTLRRLHFYCAFVLAPASVRTGLIGVKRRCPAVP